MAIDDSPSSFFSPWPDRLRHSAIILLAAALALAVVVVFGDLSAVRAATIFLCIAAAALALGAVALAALRVDSLSVAVNQFPATRQTVSALLPARLAELRADLLRQRSTRDIRGVLQRFMSGRNAG